MKKVILLLTVLCIAITGMAQDASYVRSARAFVNDMDFDKAKIDIDKAMEAPATKDKPATLLLRAQIYLALQNIDKYKASNPYHEGVRTILQLVKQYPDYDKKSVDVVLGYSTFLYYNDGAMAYNDRKMNEAASCMKVVMKIYDLNRFKDLPADKRKELDTITANARLILANSAYNLGNYKEAVPLLMACKNNPATRNAAVYQCLIESLEKLKKMGDAMAMIREGRKAYPNDVTIKNYELNFYMASDNKEETIKQLIAAAAAEPNNGVIQFNLATTYLGMASPAKGPRPANSEQLYDKAEAAFRKSLQIDPNNAVYNYNYGALFFNRATDVVARMSAITRKGDTAQTEYAALKARRNELLNSAIPYFERARAIYSANVQALKEEDVKVYKTTLIALTEIYQRMEQTDKYNAVKKEADEMK